MNKKSFLRNSIIIVVALFFVYFFAVLNRFSYYHVPDSFLEGYESRGERERQFIPAWQLSKSDIRLRDLVAFKRGFFDAMQFARIVFFSDNDTYDAIILNTDGSTSTGKILYSWIKARD